MIKTSKLYSLNMQDAFKGLIVAMGGAVMSAIQESLSAGSLTVHWKQIGLTALAAGTAYLGKNFFTPAKFVRHDAAK